MKVLASYWFSPMNGAVIGVVMVKSDHDGVVFYIGQGAGHNKENDEKRIAEQGSWFPFQAGRALFRPYGLEAKEKQHG